MKARVSVLTPVYNAEPYLAESIESILTQTFSDFEFLIVDDGSSDSSPQILRDYARKDKRIRVLTLPDNRGMPYALNYGLKRAQSPLIVRMDGDDIALPECLQIKYDYMQKHPSVGVLGCQGVQFTDEENTRQRKITGTMDYPTSSQELSLLYKCGFYPTGHNLVMYRRDLAMEVGGYREFFRYGAEFIDLFQRMWDRKPIENLPDTLYWWRVASPTSLFFANPHRYDAGVFMTALCALYRQAGRGDPIEAVKSLRDLPAYLGLSKSVTLKDLQTYPDWAMQVIRKHLRQHPIERPAKRALYGLMTKSYKNRAFSPDKKSYWARYFLFVLEKELLFSSLLHGRER